MTGSKILLASFAASCLLAASGLACYGEGRMPAVAARQDDGNDPYPVAEYHAPEPPDQKLKARRKTRGKRYDDWGVVNGTTERGSVTIFSEVEYPALPVIDSDLIAIGEITEAQAHLSNDKSGVYSEFVTTVKEVFKSEDKNPVAAGDVITAERAGGRVRYPSGKIAKVKFVGEGMPSQGRRYLLFLKRDAERETYKILTAYELRGDKVHPVDGAVADRGNKVWKQDAYRGAEASRLLDDLRREIANPSQKSIFF